MSIFATLFGNNNQQQAAPQAAPTPGQLPATPTMQTAASPGTAPNGVVPNTVPSPENENKDPLDQFKDIWQPTKEQTEGPAPLLNVDPKSLAEVSKRTDFTKLIQPEQLTAIAAGGEEAVKAFASAMNRVAQGVYAQSSFAATKIAEAAVTKAKEQWEAELPQHVKRQTVSETLRTENPALSHPAAAPLLNAIEAQITQKHPNASSAEITAMANNYLSEFAKAVNAPQLKRDQQAAASKQADGETDWSSYLSI